MSNDFSLFVDADTLNDVAKAADFNLAPPDPADNETFRAGSEPDLGSWTEALKIVETAVAYPKNGPQDGSQLVFKAVMDVLGPAEGGWKGNDGKTFYYNCFIEKAALKHGHENFKINARRLNIMKSLVAALGAATDKGVDFYAIFHGTNDVKPMVGLTVKAVVRKSRYKNRAGQTVESVDVDGFLPA